MDANAYLDKLVKRITAGMPWRLIRSAITTGVDEKDKQKIARYIRRALAKDLDYYVKNY